jgi:LCP family protein required for cell wall assembly
VLIVASWLAIGLAALMAVVVVWLGGSPLAPLDDRRVTVFDAPCCQDLLEPPPLDGRALARVLADSGDDACDPSGLPRALVRTESHPTPPLRHTHNVLLLGLDRRPGTARGGRADTLVVAVFDSTSNHVGLVSIPRDLLVLVPDHGPARVNAAYAIGSRQGRGGLAVLERVVEDTFAIPIHHTVAVDLDVFERSVDAVGGVHVDVRCPIRDNFVDPRTETGRRALDLPAGRHHLDGPTAAMYVRSRHGRSDWDRARRQQSVLVALRDRLLSTGGLRRLPALWDQLGVSVTTDMTRLDIFRLAGRALDTDPSRIHGLVIGSRHTDHWTTPDGHWVLLPRFEAIDEAIGALFSAPAPGQRPEGAVCPPADVAIVRPDRFARRRRARSLANAARVAAAGYSSSDTASNSDQSSPPVDPP